MSKEFRVSQKIFNEAWNLLPAVDRFVDTSIPEQALRLRTGELIIADQNAEEVSIRTLLEIGGLIKPVQVLDL